MPFLHLSERPFCNYKFFSMKSILVTGATGNLGRQVVQTFLAAGYQVIGTVIPSVSDMPEFNQQNFHKIIVDLLSEEDTEKTVNSIVSQIGNIDVAVLTVGGFAMGHIADTTTSAIYTQYRLNFETAYNVARPVFLQMQKQNGGRIFLVGSKPGLDSHSGKGMVAYSLAKSLLFRLADLMNEEGKDQNVVTSIIIPGTIDTPQNRDAMPHADFSKWVTAENIANVIRYYCGDDTLAIREPVIKIYGKG